MRPKRRTYGGISGDNGAIPEVEGRGHRLDLTQKFPSLNHGLVFVNLQKYLYRCFILQIKLSIKKCATLAPLQLCKQSATLAING